VSDDEPTRILFVVDGLAGGGAERSVLTVLAELAGMGHSTGVANLRPERAYAIPEGVELIACYDPRQRSVRKLGEVSRRARVLDRALAGRREPDLVISTLPAADVIVAASRLGEVAWYRVPNALSVEQLEGVGGLRRARRRARLRRTYGGRKVIAISRGVGKDLVEAVGVEPARLEVIHNPFDVNGIRSLAGEPCRFAGEDFVVCAGRVTRQKRHDRLLGAFARSSYTGRLVIVGTGSAESVEDLQKRSRALGLGDRVDLVGFQENPYPFFRHARASVLASDFEGFGRVLVESLICGTPAVSTRCPYGPDEILTGDLSVGLAELTEDSMAAALDRVLADPPPIRAEHYESFSAPVIAARYLALCGDGSHPGGTQP
jgi:glycosyltransferase involved in cell wall biosynthesis